MLTALALASGAALFTIIGFRELFQPTFNITFMAATIELGKIVAVSVLYQLRHVLGWFTKIFLTVLVLGAMAVTSMGVYGYLSSSYQRDTLEITQNEAQLKLLDDRKVTLEERLQDMDSQIAKVPEAYVTKRMELINAFKPEREVVLTELNDLNQEKLKLTMSRIEQETEFGAIILLAKSVEWLDENKAMLYFIMLVIFIFDPMAIALTHAANVGYASAANRNSHTTTKVIVENIQNDSNIEDVIKSVISPLAESVNNVSRELEILKKPATNSRTEILDSMRKT